MGRGELVRVRAEELEPGRRVRLERRRDLSEVVAVNINDDGVCMIDVDDGSTYVCDPKALLDVEDVP